jgi:hypothetical protein
MLPPAPPPKKRTRRQSSFVAAHPPSNAASGPDKPTIPEDKDREDHQTYVNVDFGTSCVEMLLDQSIHARITFNRQADYECLWLELQEHETQGPDSTTDFTIQVGHNRLDSNGTTVATKQTSEFTNVTNFAKQVQSRSAKWHN